MTNTVRTDGHLDPADRPAGPPVADRRPSVREVHGRRWTDEYDWLRDRDDPDVLDLLERENAWHRAHTAHLAPLVETLVAEVTGRVRETDLTVPQLIRHQLADEVRSYWYYSRTEAGRNYPLFSRLPVIVGAPPDPWRGPEGEEVLLDGNAEAAGHRYWGLGPVKTSPDGRLIAWTTDTEGDEHYDLHLRDLATGSMIDDPIRDVAVPLCWQGDRHVLYSRYDDARRPWQVFRHRLGTDQSEDVLVHTEPDEALWLSLSESRDRAWVLLGSGSSTTSETRLLEVGDPSPAFRLVCPRRDGVRYRVEVAGDRLLIIHNASGPDSELVQAPLEATRADQWRTLLPHVPGRRIARVDAYRHQAVVSYRADGLTAVKIIPRDGFGAFGPPEDVVFDEPLRHVTVAPGPNYDDRVVRISYLSLITPPTVYGYDVVTRRLIVLKRMVLADHPERGPYDPRDYVQRREWATAADGTRIPISVVARRDTPVDGTAPGVLYGYGAYEVSMEPSFDPLRISLLDRGVVFAIAHVRGGGELGRPWYLGGKLDRKRNSIDDFVACAHRLVELGLVDPDRLAAQGASAGGLVLGGAMNAEPSLFRAVHADVPFVDPLTTGLDPSIPLTVTEWGEWGDPLHDPDAFDYIRSYAPYHNVRKARYPALLATTSLNDTRVSYAEPAKWVAALRRTAVADPDRPVLLRTELVGGHAGASGRYGYWQHAAEGLAWLLDQLGAADPAESGR